MKLEPEIDVLIRSRFTVIILCTQEEERAVETIKTVCERRQIVLRSWDCADGFNTITTSIEKGDLAITRDPLTALDEIERETGKTAFVLLDFHECWDSPQVKRKLRTLARQLKSTNKTIFITTPTLKIPQELRNDVVIMQVPLPSADDHRDILETLMKTPKLRVNISQGDKQRFAEAALGLTAAQSQRIYSKVMVTDGSLDPNDIEMVNREKQEIIKECGALEYYSVTESAENVGGLTALKEWLRLRARAFSLEAREYGLPAPKGLALIGIPGTGKSLTAKMIGNAWKLPLLRFDVGAVFQSYIGQSEEGVRRALHLAETVAPCILWIDELEKALAHGGNDSGVSTRVFGTILTWMQERRAPCFVIATANNISLLPPELLRRGRFDEIFFLDLPTLDERSEIFSVHIAKRARDPKKFDLMALAQASDGFVGAEIEQAVVDAMYVGFDKQREFETLDLLAALKRQVPMSISQRENITALRSWLQEGRALSASGTL